MNTDEIRACFAEKRDLLGKISSNTDYQACFVAKRQLRSLGRLLRERAVLIERLAAVDGKLRGDPSWRNSKLFATDVQAVEEKQQEVLAACKRVLQQASAEQMRIGAEMGISRVMRKVKANYLQGWKIMIPGQRLNVKG